jgi:hypothetical protein
MRRAHVNRESAPGMVEKVRVNARPTMLCAKVSHDSLARRRARRHKGDRGNAPGKRTTHDFSIGILNDVGRLPLTRSASIVPGWRCATATPVTFFVRLE